MDQMRYGIGIDTDPDMWSFTSDLSIRMPAVVAPKMPSSLVTTPNRSCSPSLTAMT